MPFLTVYEYEKREHEISESINEKKKGLTSVQLEKLEDNGRLYQPLRLFLSTSVISDTGTIKRVKKNIHAKGYIITVAVKGFRVNEVIVEVTTNQIKEYDILKLNRGDTFKFSGILEKINYDRETYYKTKDLDTYSKPFMGSDGFFKDAEDIKTVIFCGAFLIFVFTILIKACS